MYTVQKVRLQRKTSEKLTALHIECLVQALQPLQSITYQKPNPLFVSAIPVVLNLLSYDLPHFI